MENVDYLTDIARTVDVFFKGLSDCGLLTTYSVQFQNSVFDISFKKKFHLVVNEFMINLQKLLHSFSVIGEDEVTITVPSKDGLIPIVLKLNDETYDFGNKLVSDESNFDLLGEVLPWENKYKNTIFTSVTTEQNCEKELQSNRNYATIEQKNETFVSENLYKEYQKPVENVLNMVYSNKKKNDISEPWQLSILENEEEDTAIDTITEVMTKNHLKDVGWQCDMCSKIFSRMQSLQDHCREAHNGTGCFECNLCGTRVMTKLSLKRHIRSHSGIKEGACTVCNKTFKRSDYLATHYKLHSGVRTHQCAICGKEFTSKTSLTLHEKVHSDQKDYSCQQCNKSFTRRDKLRDHMLRHLNIKRFQCSVCNKRYAEKRDLRTHLKIHDLHVPST